MRKLIEMIKQRYGGREAENDAKIIRESSTRYRDLENQRIIENHEQDIEI